MRLPVLRLATILCLCALAGSIALLAQESPTPSSPYPNTPSKAGANASGGNGQGANYDAKSGYQYVDHFSGPAWAIDPNHPVDFAWPGRTSINDFRPEPRDVFHMMDQVITEVPELGPDGKAVLDPNGRPVTERKLMPLQFNIPNDHDPLNPDQQAVFGRNTWLLWCGGDESFWAWLLSKGEGGVVIVH